ncbi:MAG: hypothetical protein QOK15_1927 [Nocardioidaceae bacterium]|jgi:Zn-dependent metalloprotease|nr:hypothetical protein [Nocardioidaceae bacterium]
MAQPGLHRCTILPSYLLQQVAFNGSEPQRRSALTTLLLDEGFRAARAAAGGPRGWPGIGSAAEGVVNRAIYDAHNTQQLPGTLVRSEGDPDTSDVAVNEAYAGLGDTYRLYAEQYQRDSIDDQGMPLLGTVHYDEAYDNAFWNGSQMVFGDGDGQLFNRFTISLDVIGHELTHGVTEHEAALAYLGQSGALNESISDVFGSLVKQYASQTTAADADWLIGQGLLTDHVNGVALRSMKAPGTAYDDPVLGKDPQPSTMAGYVVTSSDNGGVHINSGIPNHAFYLVATELGGYAWEKAGRIWYETLLSPGITPKVDFRGFARLTAASAAQLYGAASAEAKAVDDAWRAVGVLPVGATALSALTTGGQAQNTVTASSTSPWRAGAPGSGPGEHPAE